MDAYLVREDGKILDLAIRADSEEEARTFLSEKDGVELGVLQPKVASGMKIPSEKGVHPGIVWSWMAGPANIFGEL